MDDPADAARRDRQWVTVLLDRSASMQRGDLWQQAKAKVQTALGQLGPGDRFTLIAYDDSTASLAEVKSWLGSASEAEVNTQLERLAKPGFGGSNLGQALVFVGEAIQEAEPEADEQPLARREIIVISDLQKGSRLDAVQGYEWPTGIRVTLEQIGEDDQGNAGIEQVASRMPWATAGAAPSFRISNSANGISDELEFLAHTTAGETLSQIVHVPPGRSRVVELPGEWEGKTVERLAIRGDAAEFDNQFHFAQNRQQTVRIVYIGGDKPNDAEGSLFYLAKALSKNRALFDFQVEAVSGKSTDPLPEADLFVIGDAVDDPLAQALGQAIEGGSTALMVVQSPSQAANLGQWLGADGVVIRDIASSDYALLHSLKLDDPVLAVFRDARFSDFTNLHFWKHRELQNLPDEGIDVLARFDSGAPAWLAARRGDGRLLVMASGWTPADSQLALSTKFIPLLYSILQPVLEGKTQSRQFVVGSKVDVTRFNNGQGRWRCHRHAARRRGGGDSGGHRFHAGRSRPVHREGQRLVGDVRGEPHGGGEPHRADRHGAI